MKIFFTASTAEYARCRDRYYAIRNFLIAQGHVLTRDWLPLVDERLKQQGQDLTDVKEIYRTNMQALRDAEVVIVEDTISNFSTGHMITVALQLRKPTLVLWKGGKHRLFKQMFIHGIDSDLLQVSEYDEHLVKSVISVFLEKYDDASAHERNRFHLVLNNVERQYLDWAQHVRSESRTRVIRKALRRMIEEDGEYEGYLRGVK